MNEHLQYEAKIEFRGVVAEDLWSSPAIWQNAKFIAEEHGYRLHRLDSEQTNELDHIVLRLEHAGKKAKTPAATARAIAVGARLK